MENIYQFQTTYDRDLKSNYLVLTTEEENFDELHYEVQMLLYNKIEGILPFDLRLHNQEVKLYYDITSKQPLREVLAKKEIHYDQIIQLFKKIIRVISQSDNFLLTEDKFLINEDFIFIDPSSWEIYLFYVPYAKEPKNLHIQMRELIEDLINQISQEDEGAILLIHQIYKKTREDSFTFNALKELIEKPIQRPNNDQVAQSVIKNEVKQIKEIKALENKRNDSEKKVNIPIRNEKVIEEKEVKVYGMKTKVLAGLLQVGTLLLMHLIIKSQVFIDPITGSLNTKKLIAFFLVLIAGDVYGMLKLFHPDNKTIKLIEVEKMLPIQPVANHYLNLNKKSIQSIPEDNEAAYEAPSFSYEPAKQDEATTLLAGTEEEMVTTLLSEEVLMKPASLLFEKEGVNEEIALNSLPFVLGKLSGQVDYLIDQNTISRLHAKIIKEEEAYYIMDLNSRNGTSVNGERLKGRDPYKLKHGDTIGLSNYFFKFRFENEQDI